MKNIKFTDRFTFDEMMSDEQTYEMYNEFQSKLQGTRKYIISYLLYSLFYLNNDINVMIVKEQNQSLEEEKKEMKGNKEKKFRLRIKRIQLADILFFDSSISYEIENDEDGHCIIKYDDFTPIFEYKKPLEINNISVMHIIYDLVVNSLRAGEEHEQSIAEHMTKKFRSRVNEPDEKIETELRPFQLEYIPLFSNGNCIGKEKADEHLFDRGKIVYEWILKQFQFDVDCLIIGEELSFSDIKFESMQMSSEKYTKTKKVPTQTVVNEIEIQMEKEILFISETQRKDSDCNK